jgi:hypothetical protein
MVCVQSKPEGSGDVWRDVQSQLAECLLPDVSGVRATVAIWWCNVAIWYVALRDVAVLPWSCYITNVFTDITRPEPHLSRVLSNESPLFTDISLVLANFASVQSPVPIFQPDLSTLLPNESVLQPCVTQM